MIVDDFEMPSFLSHHLNIMQRGKEKSAAKSEKMREEKGRKQRERRKGHMTDKRLSEPAWTWPASMRSALASMASCNAFG